MVEEGRTKRRVLECVGLTREEGTRVDLTAAQVSGQWWWLGLVSGLVTIPEGGAAIAVYWVPCGVAAWGEGSREPDCAVSSLKTSDSKQTTFSNLPYNATISEFCV